MRDLENMCSVQLNKNFRQLNENFNQFKKLLKECKLKENTTGEGWIYSKGNKTIALSMETDKLIHNMHLLEGCQA
jgi:hypothetical protein